MLLKRVLGLAVAGLVLSGCVANKPRPYEEDQSEAWNVTRAAGFVKLEDAELPEGVKDPNDMTLLDNPLADAAYLGFSFTGPHGGVNPYADLGIRALELLLRPDARSAHKRFFAWMPADLAGSPEDAQKKLADVLDDASKKTMADRGNTITGPSGDADPGANRFYSYAWTGKDCHGDFECRLNIQVHEPDSGMAPQALGGYQSYYFHPDSFWGFPHVTDGEKKNSDGYKWLPSLEYLAALSANLPEWVYMYFPPRYIGIDGTDKDMNQVPVVLNKGRFMYFVKPSKG